MSFDTVPKIAEIMTWSTEKQRRKKKRRRRALKTGDEEKTYKSAHNRTKSVHQHTKSVLKFQDIMQKLYCKLSRWFCCCFSQSLLSVHSTHASAIVHRFSRFRIVTRSQVAWWRHWSGPPTLLHTPCAFVRTTTSNTTAAATLCNEHKVNQTLRCANCRHRCWFQ